MTTPDSTLPPLVPHGPRRDMVITIGVNADFQRRLDNQWEVEREINADRWSWSWADEAGASTLGDISRRHYAWLDSVGWTGQNTPLETIALIASEIGEAANECRGKTPTPKLPAELADIILRTMGMAEELGIDIEAAILAKMEANRARGTLGRLK